MSRKAAVLYIDSGNDTDYYYAKDSGSNCQSPSSDLQALPPGGFLSLALSNTGTTNVFIYDGSDPSTADVLWKGYLKDGSYLLDDGNVLEGSDGTGGLVPQCNSGSPPPSPSGGSTSSNSNGSGSSSMAMVWWIVLAIVILAALAGGVFYWKKYRK